MKRGSLHVLLAGLACLFGLVAGCGSAPPPEPAPPATPAPPSKPADNACQSDRPAWIDAIPGASVEALFAVGSGRSSGGEGQSRRKATFDARAQLAGQLRSHVNTLVRRVGKELEIEGDQGSFEAVDTFAGEQYAEQALLASAPVQFFRDRCDNGRVWVLLRLPVAGLDERIWQATAAGFDTHFADNVALLDKARALFDDAERRAVLQAGLRGPEASAPTP